MDQESKNDLCVTYERIVCPASMRSSYWKFFGFPASSTGAIISRSKIICSICKAAISYNKNTSNLRSHLNAKHSAFVKKFLEDNPSNKPKFVYVGQENQYNNVSVSDAASISDDGTKVKAEGDISTVDTEQLIGILAEEVVEEDQQKESFENTRDFVDVEYLSSLSEDPPYKIVDVRPTTQFCTMPDHLLKNHNLIEDSSLKMICDMIVTDLLPLSIVEGFGFQKFVKICNSNVELLSKKMIENELRNRHKNGLKTENAILLKHLKNHKFSLGFELWTNVEQKSYISIYLTFVKEDKFETNLLGTVESNYTEWNSFLQLFNMDQCSAAITNFDIEDYSILNQFLSDNGIPTVPCFLSLISHIADRCFATQTVNEAIKRSIEFIHETSGLLTSHVDPPEIHENFWLTKYEFLEFFTEIYFNTFEVTDADLQNLCADIKSILECLKPLKITLETVYMEQVALVSLIKPLTQQLLDTNYTIFETDTAIELELKPIIQEELEKTITCKGFLSIASFLDPRLQTLLIFNDTETESIKDRIKEICKYKEPDECSMMAQNDAEPKQKNRKSGLGLFFGNKDQKPIQYKVKNSFEREFTRYSEDVNEAFDQCPLSWWSDYGHLYPLLKEASQTYNCVPAMLCTKNLVNSQAINFENNRSLLYGESVDACLWLHINKHNE